jgi:hypothetical protein
VADYTRSSPADLALALAAPELTNSRHTRSVVLHLQRLVSMPLAFRLRGGAPAGGRLRTPFFINVRLLRPNCALHHIFPVLKHA